MRGIKAINPANGEEIPIFIADYVLAHYGTGAIMAVPAHDERDFAFAEKFILPVKEVVVKMIGKKKDNETRRDGVAAVIVQDNKYLILHDKITGEYRLPAGGYEKGETYSDTVDREIKEETGYVNFKIDKYLGQIEAHFYAIVKNQDRQKFQKGYLVNLVDEEQQPLSDEDKDKFDGLWLPYAEALEKLMYSCTDAGEYEFLKRAHDRKGNCFVENGTIVNSAQFDGMESKEAKKAITEFVGGEMKTTYKLRDWVFSRQRYWGEPIPLVFCEKCGYVPVPEEDLPVLLPEVKTYTPTKTGESPLAKIDSWVNVRCPKCGGGAKRETDTMPNWAGSSWYFLRYIDPRNETTLADRKKLDNFMPVDWYNGGMEHTTLHLLYSRFWHKFLFDIGVVPASEPYAKRTSHGMILAEGGEKMSKSKGNVVNPDSIVENFGADTLRLYEMFMGPFDQSVAWSAESIIGPRRFLERVWKLKDNLQLTTDNSQHYKKIETQLHRKIKKVGEDVELMHFNTAVSEMMILANEMDKLEKVPQDYFEVFLKLLSPFAPHITEEIWNLLGHKKSIHQEPWPKYDESKLESATINLAVQVNGKVRAVIEVPAAIGEEEAKNLATKDEKIKTWIGNKEIKRIIYIKGKLISIVLAS